MNLSAETINEAREYTVSYVQDLISAQQTHYLRSFHPEEDKPGFSLYPNVQIENLLSFVNHVSCADKLLNMQDYPKAAAYYSQIIQAVENGALERYLERPDRMEHQLQRLEQEMWSNVWNLVEHELPAHAELHADGQVVAEIRDNASHHLSFGLPRIHTPYARRAEALMNLEYNALAAIDGYTVLSFKPGTISTYEVLGDAILGHSAKRSDGLLETINLISKPDDKRLITAAYKYSVASQNLTEQGFAMVLLRQRLQDLREAQKDPRFTDPKIRLYIDQTVKLMERTRRIDDKKKIVVSLLK